MKRSIFSGVLSVAILSASVAMAAPPPQYSAQDIVGTFAKDKPAAPAPSTPNKASCESRGMVTGDDGICEPVKNERGFSLPTRANPNPSRNAAPAPAAPAGTRVASVPSTATTAARPAPRRDLLITFKTGSADLTEQAKSNARVFAQAMGAPALAGSRFEIAGYTDAVGAPDKNMALSQQRADSVKSFLVASGVDGARINAKGY
ncbi:MAG: OmpA family protein, partial [Caulobacteraceae bacterium]